MHLLWDCRSFAQHMGGIARATAGWLREFITRRPEGWKVSLIASAACDDSTMRQLLPNLDAGIDTQKVEAGFIAPRFELLQLPAILENLKVDLYFNPGFTIPAIKTTRFQATVIHDAAFLDHPEWVAPKLCQYLQAGTDLAMQRADLVFTVSEFSRSSLTAVAEERGWERADRLELLRPAVSRDLFDDAKATLSRQGASTIAGIPRDYLLYVGSVEQKKGASVLLEAHRLLVDRMGGKAPTLVLAGGTGGQPYDRKGEVVRRGLSAHVVDLGPVSEEQKRQLLAGARLFVFPSLYEGFGIPPLEAMCFGTPVVAARAASLPEVLGDAAEYVKPGDADDLALTIESLLADNERRVRLAAAGLRQVERFNWEDEVDRLIGHFARLEQTL